MARPHVAPGWSHLSCLLYRNTFLFSLFPPFLQRCAGQEVKTLTVQAFLGWLSQERGSWYSWNMANLACLSPPALPLSQTKSRPKGRDASSTLTPDFREVGSNEEHMSRAAQTWLLIALCSQLRGQTFSPEALFLDANGYLALGIRVQD